MNQIKPIVTLCKYGKIKIKLRSVMDKNGITRFEVVNKWYNGNVERIDADVLARLCFTLGCDVGDIIEYVP